MSKHLVKIISICALAILLPLVVVGVALCVTEPVACTLTIGESGENGQYSTSAISIRVDGKELEGTTAKIKKHSDITVVYTGEGYDFKGWFNGKADEIDAEDEAVSQDESFSFILRGNTTLTAVRDVTQYNITYTGFLDDGTTEVSTQLAETNQTVKYGDALEQLSPVVEGSTFGGWYEVASQGESVDATGTMTAKFSSKEVELKPVWSNQMIVTYKKGETTIAVQRVSEEAASTYALLNENSELVKKALTPGKQFAGWIDLDDQPVTSIVYDLNGITLYMQEEVIVYNLEVKYNAVSTDKVSMTYDVDSKFSTLAYETDNFRKGYTFKGLDANGTLYLKNGDNYTSTAGANLSDLIVAENITSVVAVWESDYSNFQFKLTTGCEYVAEGDDYAAEWGVFGTLGTSENQLVEQTRLLASFQDAEGEDNYDLNDNVYDMFISQYTNLHIYEGDAVEFANIIKVYDKTTDATYTLEGIASDEITFWQVLAFLESKLGNLDSTLQITITFMFEIVA